MHFIKVYILLIVGLKNRLSGFNLGNPRTWLFKPKNTGQTGLLIFLEVGIRYDSWVLLN